MKQSMLLNSIFFVLYRLLNVIYPLITVSYVSKIILAEGVGKIASAQNFVQYFVIIASLGIPNYGVREIAIRKQNKKEMNEIFSELFLISFFSTLICSIVYFGIIAWKNTDSREIFLYYSIGLTIILNIFNVDWFYQGIEDFKYITVRSLIVKIISLVAIFLFVNEADDYLVYAFIYVGGIALNNIFNVFHLKKYGIRLQLNELCITRHIKPILLLLGNVIAIELYTMVDTSMLTLLGNDSVVGYYSNAMKIVRLVITLVVSIGGILLPRLSYYRSKDDLEICEKIVNKVYSILFFLIVPSGLGIFFTAEAIVYAFFGSSFIPAIKTLRIASFLLYAIGFSNLFGTQVLLTFEKEKNVLTATICGAIVNIFLNAFLIPTYQQDGAVVASIISELVVTVVTYYYARRCIVIGLSKSFVLKTFIAAFFMTVYLAIIQRVDTSHEIYLIISVFGGGIVYILTSYVMKNNILLELRGLLKRKR